MTSKRDRPHPEPSQNPYPKEPETEIGQQARQDYLKYARGVIGSSAASSSTMDYETLYQQFAVNDWAAIKLDDAVCLAALKAGRKPQEVFGFLHQGPYVQCQFYEKQVARLTLSRYCEATVRQALQQLKSEPKSSQQNRQRPEEGLSQQSGQQSDQQSDQRIGQEPDQGMLPQENPESKRRTSRQKRQKSEQDRKRKHELE